MTSTISYYNNNAEAFFTETVTHAQKLNLLSPMIKAKLFRSKSKAVSALAQSRCNRILKNANHTKLLNSLERRVQQKSSKLIS